MHSFTWLGYLLEKIGIHVGHDHLHIVFAAFSGLVLIGMALITSRYFKKADRLIPEDKASVGNIMDIAVGAVLKLMEDIMGPRAKRYFPIIGSVFLFVFFSNLLGVLPGFLPPTDNINTNVAISLTVFIYYNVVGIREQGFGHYMKHMMGPIGWLAPLMLVIELISHFVRPMSLSIRLFGNIMGDHMVLGIFSDLTPYIVPVIFLGLGVFVSFIQAFVFSLLSTIYIALATETGEHHEAH